MTKAVHTGTAHESCLRKAWFHGRFFSAKCEIFCPFLLNCNCSNTLFQLDCSQFKRKEAKYFSLRWKISPLESGLYAIILNPCIKSAHCRSVLALPCPSTIIGHSYHKKAEKIGSEIDTFLNTGPKLIDAWIIRTYIRILYEWPPALLPIWK